MFGGSRDVLAVKDRSREWSNKNSSERGMLIIIESWLRLVVRQSFTLRLSLTPWQHERINIRWWCGSQNVLSQVVFGSNRFLIENSYRFSFRVTWTKLDISKINNINASDSDIIQLFSLVMFCPRQAIFWFEFFLHFEHANKLGYLATVIWKQKEKLMRNQ